MSGIRAADHRTLCCLQHCCFLKATYLICTQVLTAGQVCAFCPDVSGVQTGVFAVVFSRARQAELHHAACHSLCNS
jgi:hypothetical protein